jgi:predicted transcriptional regulator/transcriptional regulator with XRE-family HTH domain
MASRSRSLSSSFANLDGKPALRLLTTPAGEAAHVDHPSGPDPLVIGKCVRYRRKGCGLTLDALGERIGLSASAVSLIETGKREAKVSTLAALAEALDCQLSDLLTEAAPSRRAALELKLEHAQQSPSFTELGIPPVKAGPRLPLDALESLVALHERLAAFRAERDGTPEYARRANADLRARMRASDNYFPAIEELADELLLRVDHDGGPLTRHRVNEIADRLGFTLHSAPNLPQSTRSVTDLAGRRIFLPTSDGAAQRTLALAALGHVVLQHRPPADYAEFLAQRVEVNYFAAAVLIPQRWAAAYLRAAKQNKDLEIEDLRDRYLTSYEMAAHRFTNLATIQLDIPVHFMKINKAGIIYKAYANDGVTFPADSTGAVEGQRVCRFWTARRVFEQLDWTKPYQQYTDTPSGTFWCTAVAEHGEREAFSVAIGTPYEHVKWFRGRGTQHRSKSRCPDPSCCTLPPPELAARWQEASWPSARVHSALLASLPAGAFPGVDQTEVMEFLDRQ